MALLTRPGLLGPTSRGLGEQVAKTAAARTILMKEAREAPENLVFDIFLSHSSQAAREVLAIKELLEHMGHSVYVDWVEDRQLDRARVTPATAEHLRQRISFCRCLLVHASEGARESRWVPWELGYADGLQLPVGILPVLAEEREVSRYVGDEYLGLYPYVDFGPEERTFTERAWVNTEHGTCVSVENWLDGVQPARRIR